MADKITVAGWAVTSTDDRLPDLRQERAIQTRAQVMSAASQLFTEKGFSGTSMQDVARRVGMTKGAVYFHFPTKELLAKAVVEAHYARWPELLDSILALNLTPLQTTMKLLDGAVEAFHSDPVVQAGARLQQERSLINVPLPQPYVGWTNLLTNLLTSARAVGELRPDADPAAVARALTSGFFGVQHVSDVLNSRADLAERWNEMCGLILGTVTA